MVIRACKSRGNTVTALRFFCSPSLPSSASRTTHMPNQNGPNKSVSNDHRIPRPDPRQLTSGQDHRLWQCLRSNTYNEPNKATVDRCKKRASTDNTFQRCVTKVVKNCVSADGPCCHLSIQFQKNSRFILPAYSRHGKGITL